VVGGKREKQNARGFRAFGAGEGIRYPKGGEPLVREADPSRGSGELTRNEVEREKGFEPSTSTLARLPAPRGRRGFAGLKVQESADRSTPVVGIGGASFRELGAPRGSRYLLRHTRWGRRARTGHRDGVGIQSEAQMTFSGIDRVSVDDAV